MIILIYNFIYIGSSHAVYTGSLTEEEGDDLLSPVLTSILFGSTLHVLDNKSYTVPFKLLNLSY
jgi:hypothetical protein